MQSTFRFAYIYYRLGENNEEYEATTYDFFYRFFNKISIYKDQTMIVIFVMLFILGFSMTWLFFFTRADTVTWQMFNELIIKIMDKYDQSKYRDDHIVRITNMELNLHYYDRPIPFYGRLLTKLRIIWMMRDIDQNKLRRIRLVYFKRIKYEIIVNLIRMTLVADQINNSIITNICKLVII